MRRYTKQILFEGGYILARHRACLSILTSSQFLLWYFVAKIHVTQKIAVEFVLDSVEKRTC